jgi:cation diffusion facilitator CzcD-associated flavoprotein CzcO
MKIPENFQAVIIGSGISGIAMGRQFNIMGLK